MRAATQAIARFSDAADLDRPLNIAQMRFEAETERLYL
jgi:hypothetical protein